MTPCVRSISPATVASLLSVRATSATLQPRSAVRLGQQNLSDTVRGLEISPLLQLGVSYSV